jgi:hypothetical protein
VIAFTFPETKYHRVSGTKQVSQEALAVTPGNADKEKNAESNVTGASSDAESNRSATGQIPVGRGRPSKTQFMPFQHVDSRWKMFLVRDIFTPIRVFFNPIIFWAGLMLAGPADLVLLWNLSESFVLAAPPYNFNPAQVGYANFAVVIGAIIGLLTAGPYSDWVAQRETRKNGGIREAEMRLIALWPYLTITGLSCIFGGLGYARQWPWEVVLVLGYGFGGLSVASVPTIAIAYAIDCYKPISGEIMVCATVLKNTLGFSYSYWIFDLAHKMSWVTVSMVVFACCIGPGVFAIPLYYWGKKLRRWTKDSDFHRMEEMI